MAVPTPAARLTDPVIAPERAARIRRKLSAWFKRHRRDLPWRRTEDPYAIWLSETMLQQTQVATVRGYYGRFLKRFPTVRDLAAADLHDVLGSWAGLGYYARGRHLHAAARRIVADFDGHIPSSVELLRTLPGVGDYTAGAVASIAFDRRAPVVDGNVCRVFARLFGLEMDVRTGAGRALVWRLAERLLPRRGCGNFNQALMELGATICLPKASARCPVCPLRTECRALASDRVARLPIGTRPTAVRWETHVVAAIARGGRWLAVRREPGGLWGGLWELPSAVLDGGTTASLARRLANSAAGRTASVEREPFCRFKHQLTHRTITFVGHRCRIASGRLSKGTEAGRVTGTAARWLRLGEIMRLPISKAMRTALEHLRDRAPES
ncbi:MAG: A/G-specific adenine glycosylase [Phycisphaerae bacterium]